MSDVTVHRVQGVAPQVTKFFMVGNVGAAARMTWRLTGGGSALATRGGGKQDGKTWVPNKPNSCKTDEKTGKRKWIPGNKNEWFNEHFKEGRVKKERARGHRAGHTADIDFLEGTAKGPKRPSKDIQKQYGELLGFTE